MNERHPIHTSGTPSPQPFEGLLVVAVEQAVAAPLCSCQLADGGARVIKIERSEGDFARAYDSAVKGESAYFVWANHGKESLQLNIKEPEDSALLHRLLAQADVFIQNLAPGAMARAGFDSADLREQYSQLITCDISGYGDSGHYRDMKAYDFLVQCESGLVSISGAANAYGRIGVSVCDIGAGMNALIGIQQALLLRAQTGLGSGVKVSLFDTAADWMTVPLMHNTYGGKAPERVGMHHPSIAPYGAYTTGDNKEVVIAIQNEREWLAFCECVLEQVELAGDTRFCTMQARVANRSLLDSEIYPVFARHTLESLSVLLQAARIAFGAVNSVASLAAHPQLRTRTVTLSNGQRAELVAPPVQRSYERHDAVYGVVPKLGEHNERIRSEFTPSSSLCAGA